MTQDLTIQQAKPLPSISNDESHVNIRLHPEIYLHFWKHPEEKRLQSLKLILLSCYAIKHQTDTSFIVADASILDQLIMQHKQYRELTLNEINKALTNGAGGLYGKGYLTPEECIGWLGRFIQENENIYLEAKRRRNKAQVDAGIEEIKKRYAYMMAKTQKERQEKEKQYKP